MLTHVYFACWAAVSAASGQVLDQSGKFVGWGKSWLQGFLRVVPFVKSPGGSVQQLPVCTLQLVQAAVFESAGQPTTFACLRTKLTFASAAVTTAATAVGLPCVLDARLVP
jgi:hypothetical protein